MSHVFQKLTWTLCSTIAMGQTKLDLQNQTKNVDFSTADSTRPFKSGTALPATCAVGEMFYNTNTASGANLYGCTSPNAWTPEGQGAGIAMLAQSQDLVVTRTSSTTLAVGANCSVGTPCNVRFGGLSYSLIASATATVSAGTGIAFFYVSSSGSVTVGHNLTISCTANCSSQSGVTAFPPDSVPLYTWSATNGTWDTNGGTDLRAFQSTKSVQPGAGLTSLESGGVTILSADPTLLGIRTAPPASSSAACTTGAWAMDSGYFYICVSSGSWRRAALASW